MGIHQLLNNDNTHVSLWNENEFEDNGFLLPDPRQCERTKEDYSHPRHRSFKDDVLFCVSRAKKVGLETIVLDYTRPDIGLPTVKVVVPGLRHFWRRLGPGRLYTVPLKMKLLEESRREEEMNPKNLVL